MSLKLNLVVLFYTYTILILLLFFNNFYIFVIDKQ